jgi:hypothetical protein
VWHRIVAAAAPTGLSPEQYWGGQVVLVVVALIGAWFALRGKRVERSTKGDEIVDARLARSEARMAAEIDYLDREIAEARAECRDLRAENARLWRLLRQHGIDPDAP